MKKFGETYNSTLVISHIAPDETLGILRKYRREIAVPRQGKKLVLKHLSCIGSTVCQIGLRFSRIAYRV